MRFFFVGTFEGVSVLLKFEVEAFFEKKWEWKQLALARLHTGDCSRVARALSVKTTTSVCRERREEDRGGDKMRSR